MKYLKHWIVKLIADDIRNGGEIAKALDARLAQHDSVSRNIFNLNLSTPPMHPSTFQDAVVQAIVSAKRVGRIV